jgi:hypothetical protein
VKIRHVAGGLLSAGVVLVATVSSSSAQNAQRVPAPTTPADDVITVQADMASQPTYVGKTWETPTLTFPAVPEELVKVVHDDDEELKFLNGSELGAFRPAPKGGTVFFGSGQPLWGPAAPPILPSRVLRPLGSGDAGDRFLGARPSVNPVTVIPKLDETFDQRRESFAFIGGPPPLAPREEGSTSFPLLATVLADPNPGLDNRPPENGTPTTTGTTTIPGGSGGTFAPGPNPSSTVTSTVSIPGSPTTSIVVVTTTSIPGATPTSLRPGVTTTTLRPGATTTTVRPGATTTTRPNPTPGTTIPTTTTQPPTTNTTAPNATTTTSPGATTTTAPGATTTTAGPTTTVTSPVTSPPTTAAPGPTTTVQPTTTLAPPTTTTTTPPPVTGTTFVLGNGRGGPGTASNEFCLSSAGTANANDCDAAFNVTGLVPGKAQSVNLTLWNVDPDSDTDAVALRGFAPSACTGGFAGTGPSGVSDLCNGLRLKVLLYTSAARTVVQRCLVGCSGSGITFSSFASTHNSMATGFRVNDSFRVNSKAYLRLVVELPDTGSSSNGRGNDNSYMGRTASLRLKWQMQSN